MVPFQSLYLSKGGLAKELLAMTKEQGAFADARIVWANVVGNMYAMLSAMKKPKAPWANGFGTRCSYSC